MDVARLSEASRWSTRCADVDARFIDVPFHDGRRLGEPRVLGASPGNVNQRGHNRAVSSRVDAEGVAAVLSVAEAAALPPAEVLDRLGTASAGLTDDEVASRREQVGPNLIAVRRVRVWEVLGRQLRDRAAVVVGSHGDSVVLCRGSD